jgi:AcrR family transcriptional regulator
MTAQSRREQQRLETRDKILNAARALLLADGIAGLTMRKLADRVGYTPTALYYHFEDKDAVLRALMDADCTALRRGLDRAGKVDDPVERLRVMGAAYIDFALKNPDVYTFMMLLRRDPDVVLDPASVRKGDPAQDGYAFLKQAAADGIASGRFRPEFADPDQLAQVIWSGVHGLVSLHLTLGKDPWFDLRPVRPTGKLLIEAMLRGVVKPPS